MADTRTHKVDIHYCTGCRWLLRSAWMAQELLTTFEDDIADLTLHPGSGGIFEIYVDGQRIWSRKEMQGFPDITELKQLVRDQVSPDRALGHSDRKHNNS